MIETILYGFTIGAILYLFSIGLSLTFGTMHIINFTHAMIYTLGVYFFVSCLPILKGNFLATFLLSVLASIPVAYVVERFVIRKLYGEKLDYAIIATYGVLLIGTDLIKLIWGTTPYPVNDPIGRTLSLGGASLPVYRLLIVFASIVIFYSLRMFFKKTLVGRIVIAALEDSQEVRALGIDVNKYLCIVFIMGSALAVIGGVLYAPLSNVDPYMGFHILLLAFAVIIVGGMGNLSGTFIAAMIMGMIMAVTGRFWTQASQIMVFVFMALVLIFKPLKI